MVKIVDHRRALMQQNKKTTTHITSHPVINGQNCRPSKSIHGEEKNRPHDWIIKLKSRATAGLMPRASVITFIGEIYIDIDDDRLLILILI